MGDSEFLSLQVRSVKRDPVREAMLLLGNWVEGTERRRSNGQG